MSRLRHSSESEESLNSSSRSRLLQQEGRNKAKSILEYFANKNVRYTFLYNFVDGASYSIWGSLLFPVLVEHYFSVEYVGMLTAPAGLSQLLSASVLAFVSGKKGLNRRRELFVRGGVLLAFLGLALLLLATVFMNRDEPRNKEGVPLALLFGGQICWGLAVGALSTSTEALFADSVREGERLIIYNYKWIVQTLCYCVGYCLALFLFENKHDHEEDSESGEGHSGHYSNMDSGPGERHREYHWNMHTILFVFRVGLLIHPFAFLCAMMLSDKHCIPARHTAAEGETTADGPPPTVEYTDEGSHTLLPIPQDDSTLPILHPSGHPTCSGRVRRTLTRSAAACFSLPAVPYLVCVVDLLMAVGSGLSLSYFSPFLVHYYHYTPFLLYITYLVSTVTTAMVSQFVVKRLSLLYGRVPCVIMVRVVGVIALLFVGIPKPELTESDSDAKHHIVNFIFHPLFIACCLIVRNAFMNSVLGVTRSVVMDSVSLVQGSNKVRWSAVESFSSFTWSGSAFIGGALIKHFNNDYQIVFRITALLQAGAITILVPAIWGARQLDKITSEAQQVTIVEDEESSHTP